LIQNLYVLQVGHNLIMHNLDYFLFKMLRSCLDKELLSSPSNFFYTIAITFLSQTRSNFVIVHYLDEDLERSFAELIIKAKKETWIEHLFYSST